MLTDLLGVWYIFSAIIGSMINWTSNFLLQKHWTFQNKDTKNIRRQATSYVVMVTALFVANLALLYAFVEFMHLWYLEAQVITTAILTVVSYVATSRIFSHPTAS